MFYFLIVFCTCILKYIYKFIGEEVLNIPLSTGFDMPYGLFSDLNFIKKCIFLLILKCQG